MAGRWQFATMFDRLKRRRSEAGRRAYRFSVRSKLMAMLLATSLASLGAVTILAYQAGKQALSEAALQQLNSLRAAKKLQIETYFRNLRESFAVLADAPTVARGLDEFTEAYRQLGRQPLAEPRRKALQGYYTQTFLPKLSRATGRPAPFDEFWPQSPQAQELQTLFLVEHPPAKATVTSRLPGDIAYSQVHDSYHPWLARAAAGLDFYDVFLIDGQSGDLVYTVAKESDIGGNVFKGPLAGSNLGRVAREIIQSRRQGQLHVVDFDFYAASFNAPAAFIAAPVFKDQAFIGVIAAQISTETLARLMHDGGRWRENGLGETGAAYLIGADFMMRSDTREIVEKPEKYVEQIRSAGTVTEGVAQQILDRKSTVLLYPVRNEPVRKALIGQTGTDVVVNRRGFGVFFAYAPLDLPGLQWVVVARMDESEVLAAQVRFNRNVMIAGCALALIATLVALWLAGFFVRPIEALLVGIRRLREGQQKVSIPIRSNDEFGDLTASFNDMAQTIEARDETIRNKSKAYEKLLKQIFPEAVADRMKQGEAALVESFQQVTAVYLIVEGFAAYARQRDGVQSLKLLNEIVDRLDVAAEQEGLEKVKTIGDHYLAVSGLSVTRLDHARRALEFAVRAAREIGAVNRAQNLDLGLRVGIATGQTQAGLVGSRRFVYDVWGPAPTTAAAIVHRADLDAVRVDENAAAQLSDVALGDGLEVETSLGRIRTSQIRLAGVGRAVAAE